MFGIVIIIAAGLAWFAVGVKAAAVVVAILGFGWAVHGMRRFSVSRTASEEIRYSRSRAIGRKGVPAEQAGWIQHHAPTDWCDGWGSEDGRRGCDGGDSEKRVSTIVSRRQKNAGKSILDSKKK